MRLIDVFNSRLAVTLGLSLSSMMPPWMGYPLARRVADLVASRKDSLMVCAVRGNQWIIHNRQPNAAELDRLVRQVYWSIGRSLYDFYHFLKHPKKVARLVEFDSSFEACLRRANTVKEGTILVAPHLSNFDLVARAMVLRGLPLHILSYPKPPGGYKLQNELRQVPGLKVTPMSVEAIQEASRTLRSGRTVVTGVDRPLPPSDEASKYRLRFFGLEASMPVFHIRLALRHNLPVTVLGGCRKSDGRYLLWASDPIPLEKRPDLVEETVLNAERILEVISSFIMRAPEQWAMLYPVWPETLPCVPD